MQSKSKVKLIIYKTGEEIPTADQLPILSSQRTPTDVFCTLFTTVFAVSMLLASIIIFDLASLQKITYPTDSQGRLCTLQNQLYNYLYFPSPENTKRRVCVSQCPGGIQKKLDCWPTADVSCSQNKNPMFQVIIYPSQPIQTSTGLFCFPKDPLLRQTILNNANLKQKFDFVSAYKSIGISMITAFILGIIGVILFTFLPSFMTYISILVGGLCCLAAGILLMAIKSKTLAFYQVFIYIFAIFLIIFGGMLIYGLIFRSKQINISISYLKQADKCYRQAPWIILVSVVFLILLFGLIALITFQVLACWSASTITFVPEKIYLQTQGKIATFLTILNAIQFIWGLCFLKQAFNFIISGFGVAWRFKNVTTLGFSLNGLFRFHWGSVAAGSFLLNIFYPFDIIYDLLKPPPNSNGTLNSLCCCCERVLDLARTQSMALINMIGLPYCNASRVCQQIYYYTSLTNGSESANTFVRVGGHVFLASLSTLAGWIYMNNNDVKFSNLAIIISFVVSIFVLTFFICLLKDLAQSIFFCDLVENNIEGRNQIQPEQMIRRSSLPRRSKEEGYQILPNKI